MVWRGSSSTSLWGEIVGVELCGTGSRLPVRAGQGLLEEADYSFPSSSSAWRRRTVIESLGVLVEDSSS